MNTKTILIFVAVTLGVLLGVGALLTQFSASSEQPITDIAGESLHSMGKGSVKVVEFSDFQCPACLSVQGPLKQILAKYEGKVEFVYRYFPLTQIHKNAQSSAQAAEAAGIQDKFWEMHDKLFETQKDWESLPDPKEKFSSYAVELGLDKEKYNSDFGSVSVKDAIAKDVQAANQFKINGTPTFYVNGIKTEFGQIEARIKDLTK